MTFKTEAIKETVELKNEGDRNIEKFLSAKYNPRCAGSFDRRVYARMFAECEVEKWYEVLNYCQEGDDTSNSLDTTLNKDQKQEHALFFNKLKELPIERNVHRQETKKKERGGIFRFFRWLRRNKSKSSSSSTGGGHGPGARRTLSTIRMSDSGRGKAKSLDSVTSLSQSFHYIPVGVVSSEGDLNRCETPPFKERVYEDVDHHCTPQASPAKLPKCLSLSRGVITEGMESRDDVCKERLQHGSVRSAFSSNSVSLSFVKKKRRAPLPPLTNSAPAPGSNWVKGIPLMNETNDLPRSSSAFSSPQVSSGRLQRNPTASSTGAICKRLPDEEGTRTVSYPSDMYSKFKHKRSVSLTTADIPAPFTTNPTAKHQRVGSHVKNKRKAPAPPSPGVTRNEPLSKPSVSADHPEVSNQIASKREAEGQETKSKSTSTTSLTNNHANKSQSSASHIEDGLTRGVKKDVAEVPPILPEKTKCKPLAKPTNDNFIFREPQKRMHSSMYVTNEDNVQKSGSGKSSEHFDDTRSHQTHMKDKVFQGNRETFKEKEPEQATNLDMEKKKPENCELPHKPHRRTSKTSSSSSNSSPSTSKLKNLNIDENIGGDFPQQESQMNIEALQNLVESLVVLYCGNNQKKDENPNYINVNCGNTEPKLFESGFENETGLSGKKTTKHRATDSGCQMIKLKSGHPVIDSNDTWVKSVRTRCPVAATDVSDCTVSTSNGEPEGCDDGDDIDDPGERARSPLTSTSNDQEEDGNNDDVVDSDFANELLERWQTRMREQLLNMDLNVHEDKHRLSEKLLLNNIKEVDAGDDVGSGIYEPIGNFIYSPNMECKSQIAAGDNVVISDQHTDGNSCKNRENEHHSRSEACNSVPRSFQHGGRRVTEPSDIRSEIEQNDVCKDPFSFWRDLCARESLDERRATQDVSRRKCSEDLIRRLSVNGHWQSMKNNSDDDQGIQNENSIAKNEDRSICADSKSSKASRTPDFYSEKERDFHYYENTFTATPHRVVVVDGITIPPQFTTCSPAVPAYWPPAPLMAYGHLPQQQQHHHQQQQHCSHFPALAIVPLSSAIPQQVFASRPFSGGGFVMTSAPSRVTTLGIPNVPTDATHDPGGPYANRQTERMVTNPPIAKRLTQNPISQDVYQNRGGEYHKQKSNEKRQQSPIVISDEEDTDEDEESSDSSGKRTYANVWHRCSRGTGQDKNTYANVPPPSPSSSQKRENRRGCSSSRLSANCNWLKESSKTVEAKIKAAQDGSSPVVVGDSGEHSGSQPSQNPTSTTAFRSLVTRKDGDALAVASKPPPHPSKAQESTVSSNIELQVVAQAKTASPSVFHLDKSNNGKRRELTRVVHSIESLARETFLSLMDYCVIIGGVKVATPFRLWPLEYELVAPELEKLEGLLNGNAPTEDLLSGR